MEEENKRASRRIFARAAGFAVVVTDKNGWRFVRMRGNGHPTVCSLVPESPAMTEQLSRDICWFHSKEIAECYGKDTIDLVKMTYRGTKICPRAPFKAEVVPLSFNIG